MKIKKRIVLEIEKVYSITLVPSMNKDGLPAFIAGSEDCGPLVIFEPPDYNGRTLATKPGGFISLCSFTQNGESYCVAATDFKPGFNAADCSIYVYPLSPSRSKEAYKVAHLPYTHRIAIVNIGGRNYLLGSTLCSGKKFKDDWSKPGGIYIAEIPDDISAPWQLKPIVGGLQKNHGMDFARFPGHTHGSFLLSCMGGLFCMQVPEDAFNNWNTELIANGEHSDAFYFEGEIFAIKPFHGNVLCKYSSDGKKWTENLIDDSLQMGHVIWTGNFLGENTLIVGQRQGEKELQLYRKHQSKGDWIPYSRIDSGIGPTQVAVFNKNANETLLIVAGHGKNEVIIYEITK